MGVARGNALFSVRRKLMARRNYRPDKDGPQRGAYEKNRRRVFATQQFCAICGQPVDFSLKFPDPMSATIDHIIPVSKGGHPSDINNMQLAHLACNNAKRNKMPAVKAGDAGGGYGNTKPNERKEKIDNRQLPQSIDWTSYKSEMK